MKHFLQHIGDLVLISKPCARPGRMASFYFPVKNARNECPLFLDIIWEKARSKGLCQPSMKVIGDGCMSCCQSRYARSARTSRLTARPA